MEYIGWDDWFSTFDGNDLAFLYREERVKGKTARLKPVQR